MKELKDIVFATVNKDNGEKMDLKMNIFKPENVDYPTPVLVYIFGGGWLTGEYTQAENTACYWKKCLELVEKGIAVVSTGYRLSDEAIFPAQIHDVKGAVRFLRAHAKEYGIDTDSIGVMGNSSGGHLTALLATSGDVKELEGSVGGNLEYSSRIQVAVDFYGPTDLFNFDGDKNPEIKVPFEEDVSETMHSKLVGFNGAGKGFDILNKIRNNNDENSPYWHKVKLAESASPIKYITLEVPPIMIAHGAIDPVVPIKQSIRFYEALTSVGIDATFITHSKGVHGPSLGKDIDDFACQFLIDHLKSN